MQATLGNGNSTGSSMLQCKVANKSPVLLCSLKPTYDTCHLEVEFEEYGKVVFSVLGQRSIHLSGHFIGSGWDTGGDNFYSHDEDVRPWDAEDFDVYDNYDREDEYEADFTGAGRAGDVEIPRPSPERKSSENLDDEKATNESDIRRRLRIKHFVSDSDADKADSEKSLLAECGSSGLFEIYDENCLPISLTLKKEYAVKNAQGNTRSDDKETAGDKKRKVSAICQDSEYAREPGQPCDSPIKLESGDANKGKPKKKKKDQNRKPVETAPISSADEMVSADQNQASEGEKADILNDDKVQLEKAKIDNNDVGIVMDVVENDKRSKKKKKERVKKGKTTEVVAVPSAGRTEGKSKEDSNKTLNNGIVDENLRSSVEPEKLSTDKDAVDHSICQSSGVLKKNDKRMQNDENQLATEGKLDVDDPELQNSKEIENNEKIDEDVLETQPPNDTHENYKLMAHLCTAHINYFKWVFMLKNVYIL